MDRCPSSGVSFRNTNVDGGYPNDDVMVDDVDGGIPFPLCGRDDIVPDSCCLITC